MNAEEWVNDRVYENKAPNTIYEKKENIVPILPWIPAKTWGDSCYINNPLLKDFHGTIIVLFKKANRYFVKTLLCEYGHIPSKKLDNSEIVGFIPITIDNAKL